MKKFTIKDFLLNSSPCFACSERLIFSVGVDDLARSSPEHKHRSLTVTTEGSYVDLRTTYSGKLSLYIDHKTNRFKTNSLDRFKEFNENKRIFIRGKCVECHSYISSQFLEFNMVGGYVKPVGISHESIRITDKGYVYVIDSFSFDESTIIMVFKNDSSPVRMSLPFMSQTKFKNKDKLIEKIKLYLIFS